MQPRGATPPSHRFLVLLRGAIVTTGRQPIPTLWRTVRHHAKGPLASEHRLLSHRRWSIWALARLGIPCLLDQVVPPGAVLLAGEDTGAARPGPPVFGKGRPRDGVRSTHRALASRWGPQWGVWSGLVTGPLAVRPWARPLWGAW